MHLCSIFEQQRQEIRARQDRNQNSSHSYSTVPFRQSKLTHLLADSFTGRSMISVILTASLNSIDIEQSMHTCRFGEMIRKLVTRPVQMLDSEKNGSSVSNLSSLLEDFRKESLELQQKLAEQGLLLLMLLSSILWSSLSCLVFVRPFYC